MAAYAPDHTTPVMQVLAMPNGGTHEPPPWVPGDVARCASINWEMQAAVKPFGKVFDALFAEGEEGVYDEVQGAFRDDPNGPQIDLRKEFFPHLGGRVIALSTPDKPYGSTWERTLLAVEVTDEAAVARVIDKVCTHDRAVKKIEIGGRAVYETTVAWLADDGPPTKRPSPKKRPDVRLGVPPLWGRPLRVEKREVYHT